MESGDGTLTAEPRYAWSSSWACAEPGHPARLRSTRRAERNTARYSRLLRLPARGDVLLRAGRLDAGVAQPAEIGWQAGGARRCATELEMVVPEESVAGDHARLLRIAVQHGDDPVDERLDGLPLSRLDAGIEVVEFRTQPGFTASGLSHRSSTRGMPERYTDPASAATWRPAVM